MTQAKGYSNVLEEVLDSVKDLDKGVLSTCVKIMAPESADDIIEHFSISPSASFYDDLQVLNEISSFQPVLERVDLMSIRNMPLIGLAKKTMAWNSSISIGLIIIAALVIVGLWNSRRPNNLLFKKQIGKMRPGQKNRTKDPTFLPVEERGADLCLVIPCERVGQPLQKHLHPGISLSFDEAVALVDGSVYFLVIESAKNIISRINLGNDLKDFPEGSDLFVQLNIPDGSDLLGTDLKRSLSRAISVKKGIIIKKIGLLEDLNNLEKFHRA